MADGRGISGAIPFMIDRITHWKMPTDLIGMLKWAMQSPYYSAMKSGAMAAIGGYLLKELDINPTLNRVGKILTNVGTGAATGSVAGPLLWLPAITSSPPDPSKYTGSGNSGYGGNPSREQFNKWMVME